MPESPRFLYARKKFSAAASVMERAAKINLKQDCQISFVHDGTNELVPINANSDDNYGKSDAGEVISAERVNDSETLSTGDLVKRISKGLTSAETEKVDELQLNGSLKQLFSVPVYRRNLLFMLIVWSFCTFSFFIVPYYLDTLPGNLFLMSAAIACAELLANTICLITTNRYDTRK